MKRLLHLLGSALAVVSIVYIVFRLAEYRDQLDLGRLTAATWALGAALVLVYAAACTLLALGWKRILDHLGAQLPARSALQIFGQSQLAKYVPGNVMHFLGRQALGMAKRVEGWALAKSTLWEFGLQALAALPFFPLALPSLTGTVGAGSAIAACAATLALLYLALRRWFGAGLAGAFACYSGLLWVMALVFVLSYLAVSGGSPGLEAGFLFGGAYVCAWLIGMVTPGASAGIGIREVVVLALLGPVADEPTLLLAVLLSRVITTLGDFLFFGLSCAVREPA